MHSYHKVSKFIIIFNYLTRIRSAGHQLKVNLLSIFVCGSSVLLTEIPYQYLQNKNCLKARKDSNSYHIQEVGIANKFCIINSILKSP